MSDTRPITNSSALDLACAAIFTRWLKYVPAVEAREQADQFRRRCENLFQLDHLTVGDLDATLEIVADCMANDFDAADAGAPR